MELYLPTSFQSLKNSDHSILYTHLNKDTPHTLLFCYGAGVDSRVLTRYQNFIATHAPTLALICVDRWTQGTTAAQTGPAILSELTSITLELLTALEIANFSIAAHSAGAYQMLDLVAHAPSRIQHIFPICTHIPAPFTSSNIMNLMCKIPTTMFNGITKLDSSLANTAAERLFLKVIGSTQTPQEDNGTFVDDASLRKLLDSYEPTSREIAINKHRMDFDYRLIYTRLPGIGVDILTNLYIECPGRFMWFTCNADIFFGHKSVERIVAEMKNVESEVVVVDVPEASHADIWLRTEVWKAIYERILTGK